MIVQLGRQIMGSYNRCVIKYPLFGMALTSGAGMCIGNSICQTIMYQKTKQFNLYQVAQYGAFGFFVSGPFMRYWWYALELKIFTNPKAFLRPVQMTLFDQATTPYVLNAAFIYFINKSEGLSNSESFAKVKKNLLPVVFESYKFWPAATLLNFYLIPLHNRVLFSNLIAIAWATYLTFLLNEPAEGKEQKDLNGSST